MYLASSPLYPCNVFIFHLLSVRRDILKIGGSSLFTYSNVVGVYVAGERIVGRAWQDHSRLRIRQDGAVSILHSRATNIHLLWQVQRHFPEFFVQGRWIVDRFLQLSS